MEKSSSLIKYIGRRDSSTAEMIQDMYFGLPLVAWCMTPKLETASVIIHMRISLHKWRIKVWKKLTRNGGRRFLLAKSKAWPEILFRFHLDYVRRCRNRERA